MVQQARILKDEVPLVVAQSSDCQIEAVQLNPQGESGARISP
jgi:hypothetical protein